MPVNHELKTIFVHIPKTGGSFIEYGLGMHGGHMHIGLQRYLNQQPDVEHLFGAGMQHLTARQIRKKIGAQLFDAYFKFSIVRNPFDRMVSFVAWLDGKWERGEQLSIPEFRAYVSKAKTNRWMPKGNPLPVPQHKFIYLSKRLAVDVLIHFEKLSEQIPLLEKEIGVSIKDEVRMKSFHQPFAMYYDEASYQLVKSYYRNDFRLFGYSDKKPMK